MSIYAAFFIAAPAFAQSSGHFVLISQGIQNATSTGVNTSGPYYNNEWHIHVGNGYEGTTTSVSVAGTFSLLTSGNSYPYIVTVDQYSDSSYSSRIGRCRFDSQNLATGNYDGDIQLTNLFSFSGLGCRLDPASFVDIDIVYEAQWTGWTSSGAVYRGVAQATFQSIHPTWTVTETYLDNVYAPNFGIVANGFQITPTPNSTGLFLSGAQEFCNSYFSSSTNPISGLAQDFGNAICQAVGYLFVPTPTSYAQYQGLPLYLQNVLPFSYFYGVGDIFTSMTASTTQNFPVYSMGLSQLDFASSTAMGPILPSSLEFLSSSTINRFLPVGMHDLLYNLMIFVIWVDVAFVLYHKVVPKKAVI